MPKAVSPSAKTSRIPNFYKLTPHERVAKVQAFTGLSDEDVLPLLGSKCMLFATG